MALTQIFHVLCTAYLSRRRLVTAALRRSFEIQAVVKSCMIF